MTGTAGFGAARSTCPRRGFTSAHRLHACKTPPRRSPRHVGGPPRGRDARRLRLRAEGAGERPLGYQSITVPGSLKAFHEAQTAYGGAPWAQSSSRPSTGRGAGLAGEAARGLLVGHRVSSSGVVANPERLRFSRSGRALHCRRTGAPSGSATRSGIRSSPRRCARSPRAAARTSLPGRAGRARSPGDDAPSRRSAVVTKTSRAIGRATARRSGYLPRLAAGHQSPARRRADAAPDAQYPGAVRSPGTRAQQRGLSSAWSRRR